MLSPLLAAHISDGVLLPLPQVAGILVTVVLLAVALRQLPDEQMPIVVMCTAVFFVGSLVHVRIGPTSVHLLLNGLVGLLLGFRAVIPIAVGLLMQAVLFAHGGYLVWGVNCCVFLLPALAARPLFRAARNRDDYGSPVPLPFALAVGWLLCPISTLPIWYFGQRLRIALAGNSLFAPGFAVGFLAAVFTVTLNAGVLIFGGIADWKWIAVFGFAAHLPIAIIEGVIVGFALEAIGAARPELLASIGARQCG